MSTHLYSVTMVTPISTDSCGQCWTGPDSNSPLCSVCLPPERTPLGSMPVGVRPFSVNTFSLSSLQEITEEEAGMKNRVLLKYTEVLVVDTEVT